MIAYNHTSLDNLFIQNQADKAYNQGCLSAEECGNIKATYPVDLYTPNIFIRAGLFLLTIVIAIFSFGLLSLLLIGFAETGAGGLAVFFGLLAYAALEHMVKSKKHYQSGVDDALLWMSAAMVFGGIIFSFEAGALLNCCLALFISAYCAIRFADTVMSIVAYLSLLGILFFTCIEIGTAAKVIVPFVLMVASAVTYFVVKKMGKQQTQNWYGNCLMMVEIAALVSFYAAGNFFLVRELSNSMFNLDLQENQSIPFGWLFWIFTIAIPFVYLARGIQKKDAVLIRVGLILFAAVIFTVRYYHSAAPLEVVMTFGGILLIGISYALIKYLATPKHGFTYEEIKPGKETGILQIESLIIAETFSQQPAPESGTKFGGGSFGGGGAGGEF